MRKVNPFQRLLDFYIGIPLLFVYSVFKFKKKQVPSPIFSLAIIRTAAIGDTILLSGIIKDIKIQYKNIKITLITGISNQHVVQFMQGIDQHVILDSLNPVKNFKNLSELGSFDVAINFGQWPRIDAITTLLVKAKIHLGFNTKGQYHHFAYDISLDHSNEVHELVNFQNLISLIGVRSNSLPLLDTSKIMDKNKFQAQYGRYIVLIPWSSGRRKESKEWNNNHWISLIQMLTKSTFFDSIIICGVKSEVENANAIINGVEVQSKIRNLVGVTAFDSLVSLISGSSLVVSVNTGGMHIASALHVPLVGIDGVVPHKRWGALSPNTISFECEPEKQYINLGFEEMDGSETFSSAILPEDVYAGIMKLITP